MLLASVAHTDALPPHGEHARNPEALALMLHVLDCVRALRWACALCLCVCVGGQRVRGGVMPMVGGGGGAWRGGWSG